MDHRAPTATTAAPAPAAGSPSRASKVMRVQKRSGELEEVSFDKVLARVRGLCDDERLGRVLEGVNAFEIAQKVCTRIYDGVRTSQLDELAAQLCSSLVGEHPDYGVLAARIAVSDMHKNTSPSFSATVERLHGNSDVHGEPAPLVSDELLAVVRAHRELLDASVDYARDYEFDYFGYRTLERGYLTRMAGAVVERPQQMLLRVALGIHGADVAAALETYEAMSRKRFVHATPTLFNAGTRVPQQSSCYVLAMKEDSIAGMYATLADCAQISKYAGGVGLHVHNIRACGSYIRGTNGTSSGLLPMLRVYNMAARHVNQAGKRNGSIAVYLEPWHADIEAFLELKKNHGNEDERARDLFYALWIPDLFMERVRANGVWSLMCPDECRGLSDACGDEFRALYESYENNGRFRRQVRAQALWNRILEAQIETGTPFMLYKDTVNRKCNQRNLGTIKSSNLCCEITEYSSSTEQAVCNLASVCLPSYIAGGAFDFGALHAMVRVVVRNLNKVIDNNLYPTPETRRSNLRNRPVGVGVQGLADVFALLRVAYDSPEAAALNRDIFETIYHAAVEESVELAVRRGELIREFAATAPANWRELPGEALEGLPRWRELRMEKCEAEALADPRFPAGAYASFAGSPASEGLLQFDLWGVQPGSRYDWAGLKERVRAHGMRNSLLVAPMPTASTSQIMGFNECFEPFTSNLYKRKTLAGEFIVVNKHLMRDLMELGLWTPRVREQIVIGDGSVQHIAEIPPEVRERYKTVWEIKQRVLINMAADRGPYVCQSQSMNLFVESPDLKKLTAMHFYAWEKGLKTGMYYLRTKPKSMAQQFTVDPRKAKSNLGERAPAAAATAAPADPAASPGDEQGQEEVEQQAVGCQWKPGCRTCSS
eukprot:m51a1_g7564 putative ribonucleoside-diphosphate alpha subunit (885) ;mRNA; r:141375-144029